MTNFQPALAQDAVHDDEEWQEDSDDSSEESDDGDIDAEAQEMARRLGEELWAAMNHGVPANIPSQPGNVANGVPQNRLSRKGEAVVTTMKAILAIVEDDPLAKSILGSAVLPDNGENVLSILHNSVSSGSPPENLAKPLSDIVISLARSETLFGTLRHSNASFIQLDRGKRKREETDDTLSSDSPASKRQYAPSSDLQSQVAEAVRVISQTLGNSPNRPLDPALVSSVRLQLHQVFLFAVTSSSGGGQDMHPLQEIGGLIQVIGVLSGIPIGQTPETQQPIQPPGPPTNSAYHWLPSQAPPTSTDIGTAVYPCLIGGCRKTFSRLYNLRAHQRIHAVHRPFRCHICPASFARNHDLKRHVRLHDRKAWKCGGCHKIFSRRDAIKRHKNGSKTRGPKSEVCVAAEVFEVELDEEQGEDNGREERRVKMWTGIAMSEAVAPHHLPPSQAPVRDEWGLEEGELQPELIASAQATVLTLHKLLQAHVGNALGSPMGQSLPPSVDAAAGQATLASVIARVQLQNMSSKATPSTTSAPHDTSGISSSQVIPANDHSLSTDTLQPVKESGTSGATVPTLSMYGLSDEQTKLLEEAIANAASAAQAQAEAEAALEEEDSDEDSDEESEGSEGPAD